MRNVERFFKTALVFAFIGPWIGAIIWSFCWMVIQSIVNGRPVDLLLSILGLPVSSLGGIFYFFPPALSTGLIAAVFRLKRTKFSLMAISVIGAVLSFIYAARLFQYGPIWIWLMFSALGFCASYICGRFTFPVANIAQTQACSP